MSHIQQSENYLWLTDNVLGSGATSKVYEGMHKENGALVAVKCYNPNIPQPEKQFREFELLPKIKHENIVSLLAIEENLERRKVIIMELCNGGNLLDHLLDPMNGFGLEESEYLLFLKHLCSGMKYLIKNNIIHRDIKPGNIMKHIQEDGTSLYKIADFGAARELKEDETFESIYGTKQYLHPDVFQTAILKKEGNKAFNFSVDLWSTGITLYHVATGTLPFGVLPSKEHNKMFHKIMTQKPSGVISGIQSINGQTIWSRELPKFSILSDGLKKNLEPIIAGLLEADHKKIWDFNMFFTKTDILLSQTVVHIFYANQARLIKIYMLPIQTFEDLQQFIKNETNIEAANQILLYKGKSFKSLILDCAKISEYPSTSQDDPLFLYSKETVDFSAVPIQILQWENFPINISSDCDAKAAKNACILGHLYSREIDKYSIYCKLIYKSVQNFISYITDYIKQIQLNIEHLYEKTCILAKTAKILYANQKINKDKIKEDYAKLKTLIKDFATVTSLEVTNLYNKLCIESSLDSNWSNIIIDIKCPLKALVSEKGKTQIREMRSSWHYFVNQPITSNLTYIESQWHTLERQKVRQRLCNVQILLQKETFCQYQGLGNSFEEWYKTAHDTYLKIGALKAEYEKYEEVIREFEKELTIDSSNIKNIPKNTQKSKNNEQIRKYIRDIGKDKENTIEMLSQNSRLMEQMQDLTKSLQAINVHK